MLSGGVESQPGGGGATCSKPRSGGCVPLPPCLPPSRSWLGKQRGRAESIGMVPRPPQGVLFVKPGLSPSTKADFHSPVCSKLGLSRGSEGSHNP